MERTKEKECSESKEMDCNAGGLIGGRRVRTYFRGFQAFMDERESDQEVRRTADRVRCRRPYRLSAQNEHGKMRLLHTSSKAPRKE
jgi:hypothetical protein